MAIATTKKTEKKDTTARASKAASSQHATPVSREQISDKAYQFWLERDCRHGFDIEDWLRAERELLEESLV